MFSMVRVCLQSKDEEAGLNTQVTELRDENEKIVEQVGVRIFFFVFGSIALRTDRLHRACVHVS